MSERPIIPTALGPRRFRFPQPPNPKALPQPVAKALRDLAELEERRDSANKELYALDTAASRMQANDPELGPTKAKAEKLRPEAADLRDETLAATEAAVELLAEQGAAILSKNNENFRKALEDALSAADDLVAKVAAVDGARLHSQWARAAVRGNESMGRVPAVGTELRQRNGYELPAAKAAEAVADSLRKLLG